MHTNYGFPEVGREHIKLFPQLRDVFNSDAVAILAQHTGNALLNKPGGQLPFCVAAIINASFVIICAWKALNVF